MTRSKYEPRKTLDKQIIQIRVGKRWSDIMTTLKRSNAFDSLSQLRKQYPKETFRLCSKRIPNPEYKIFIGIQADMKGMKRCLYF
jgi:hypothetical protein